jgi:hypothetical protein
MRAVVPVLALIPKEGVLPMLATRVGRMNRSVVTIGLSTADVVRPIPMALGGERE